ncbi:alkane 1-monooxygenase [Shewanella sp. WXL01]|uniref:alkane 1-monooxygenase n=1 Tax=Shewanella sp. WXL01 TaxID=2709721 RepID=UPI00143848DB|nr:alkane 1-monooxygenase [Shewanella sp. WXL01]NKF49858.1 alkane 1-monooxygenase [Shewanella sp. WXL01]
MAIWHYLKFMTIHLMGLYAVVVITLGQEYIVYGYLLWTIFYIGGDGILGDDTSTPEYKYPKLLTWQLWLALPLLCLITFVFCWHFAPTDIANYGYIVEQLTGYNANAAKSATPWYANLVLCVFVGFVIGVIGTVTGHELIHRLNDKISLTIGRWLLAFSFDANFSIEHVFGHHRHVSTDIDPASAPRGRNVYQHIWRSTIDGNISAWRIEQHRLAKRKQALFSVHNQALRGYAMSLLLVVIVSMLTSWQGLAFFVITALWAKATLEIVNYMEHYGLVRERGTRVQAYHSWNTNKLVSSWSLFNLTRHSHHHAKAQVKYQDLKPYQDAPMMISGYLFTVTIAMIPPLWHKLMIPKLKAWDCEFASEAEKVLADKANQQTGMAAYMAMHAS